MSKFRSMSYCDRLYSSDARTGGILVWRKKGLRTDRKFTGMVDEVRRRRELYKLLRSCGFVEYREEAVFPPPVQKAKISRLEARCKISPAFPRTVLSEIDSPTVNSDISQGCRHPRRHRESRYAVDPQSGEEYRLQSNAGDNGGAEAPGTFALRRDFIHGS